MSSDTTALYSALWAHVEPEASRSILLAALEEFAQHGFQGATTRNIAERAGMSRAGVYVHYASKAELLYEIAQVGHLAVLEEVTEAVAEIDQPSERVRAFVESFTSWHARFHTLARVIQYEMNSLAPERLGEIRVLRRRFNSLVEAELRRGVATGEFDLIDRHGTVTAILSLGIDVARWFGAGRSPDPGAIGRLYGELVLRMLSPRVQ